MIGESVPKRSTRHHRCDFEFLELLEEDFGISRFSLRQAFMGVPPAPKKQAIEVCEWATGGASLLRAHPGVSDHQGRH